MVVLIRLLLFLFMFVVLSPIGFKYAYGEIVPLKNAKLKSIDWGTTPALKKRFNSYFEDLLGKPWDVLSFKIKIDQIGKELFTSGYFSSTIKTELTGSETNVVAKVTISANERINFHFTGNTVFSYQELRSQLVDKVKNDFGKLDRGALGNYINDIYEKAGFYNTSVRSYQNDGKDLEGVTVKTFFFNIEEGEKLKVTNLIYRGNVVLKEEDIESLFKKNGTSLALAGYYDKIFFDNFTTIIKKEYLARGFVFAEVSKPRVVTSDEDESLTIEYGISEKQQVVLKSITLDRIENAQQEEVKSFLVNKEGAPLNVVELEADLKKLILHFQSQGYYFANIANLNGESLLVYDKAFTSVVLRPVLMKLLLTGILKPSQMLFNEK